MTHERLVEPRVGALLALASGLAVGAWAVHLFALTALARLDQLHPRLDWVLVAITVVTALPCMLVIAFGLAVLRAVHAPEAEGSPMGRTVFLAWMAVVIGAFNLLLIVLEAVFVTAIDRRA
jgi:hypothetical protein